MKINKIELCFENCETCELQPNMFRLLIIKEIYKDKLINCYQYRDGEIQETLNCKYFYIEINEKGLEQKTYLGMTLKERLENYKDIASIIIDTENNEEQIYVLWDDIDNYENDYQTNTYINSSKKMIIEIKEKTNE